MLKPRVKFIIKGLVETAVEKVNVLGEEDAMPELLRLKETAEDLACFWGCEELEGYFADTIGPAIFSGEVV